MLTTSITKRISLAVLIACTAGCDNSVVGAYNATMESGDGKGKTVGIAVIQKHNISADGQDVAVASWSDEDGAVTALDKDGKRIIRFLVQKNGDLVQETPAGKIVFKRFAL
ncbi:TPA: hypothetical protein ACP32N_005106 [Pseudomonas aeruginosa]